VDEGLKLNVIMTLFFPNKNIALFLREFKELSDIKILWTFFLTHQVYWESFFKKNIKYSAYTKH